MQLYILRHGIAYEQFEWPGSDASRPLTVEGMKKTRLVVQALQEKKKMTVDAIWSSPLVRALQTATIAAELLGQPVSTVVALSSGTCLKNVLEYAKPVKNVPQALLLVGHGPDCGMMVSELIGDPRGSYEFKKASCAALNGQFKPGGMRLDWLLAPKDVL